jgi:hypothetical protein
MVYGIWYMIIIWYMVYGIWYMVYGIWYMIVIWYMVYGFVGFMISGLRQRFGV